MKKSNNIDSKASGYNYTSGEIIEARQALFFIATMLLLTSIYPVYSTGFTPGIILNLSFAASAFALGTWSKTNPVQAFKIGFFISLLFVFIGFFFFIITAVVNAVFSLAFYRGWKYAKLQQKDNYTSSRDDILDDEF